MPINLHAPVHPSGHAGAALADRATGLAIVALLPGLFWAIVTLIVGQKFNVPHAPTIALAIAVGSTVALFLMLVCASLILRQPQT